MWLKVQDEGTYSLKLLWGNERGPYPRSYLIGAATLRKVADEVRSELHRLTTWTKTSDHTQLPDVLRRIAKAGARLRFVLLDPANGGDIEELKTWLGEQYAACDTSLSVIADPDISVPWGLVFDGDPDTIPDDATDMTAYAAFWNMRYTLGAVLSGCSQPAGKLARPRENFRLLSVINRDIYAAIAEDLGDRMQEFDQLVKQPVGISFTLDACDALIDQAATRDTIFHFLGHGSSGKFLHLDEDQEIDPIKLKMWIDKLTKQAGRTNNSCSLLFLNACDSAVSADDYSLRSAAARPGICGYIAAETMIPRQFAIRFGLALLQFLSNGHSIGESMAAIRRDPTMWPMSLLYGCYAYPEYRIQSAPAPSQV